jgi:hypothetical protein
MTDTSGTYPGFGDQHFWDIIDAIQQSYPGLLPILNQPGVFDVAAKIIDGEQSGTPMTPDQITAALQNTQYFQNTPQAQRTWDIGAALDPATYQQKISDYTTRFNNIQAQLGVQLPYWVGIGLMKEAAVNGWDDTRMKYQIMATDQWIKDPTATGAQPPAGGQLGESANQVHQLASAYGVNLSDQATMNWADQLASGAIDQQAVQGYMIEQAKSLYPQLSSALDQGITVAQYTDPYKQMAVQELGINPNDFNLTDPKWQASINQVDPKTGARTAMSLQQWQTTLRTDNSYGYDTSPAARQQASDLATKLGQEFGAIG